MSTSAINGTGSNATVINQMNASAASASNSSASSSANASQQLTGNLNTFLNMLTTQLQHQDPLSPMDDTQFTNQLVQFSQVEQQININSNLTSLINLQKTSQQASAVGYIGQTVEATSSTLPLESGQSYFNYTLPSAAGDVTVNIKDSTGSVVASMSGLSGTAGTHQLAWNGTDSSGKQLADGAYSIDISATDSSGAAVTATTAVYGLVTGVSSDPTAGTELQMGAASIPLSSVTSVVQASSLGGTSNNSTTSSNNAATTNNAVGG